MDKSNAGGLGAGPMGAGIAEMTARKKNQRINLREATE
jgi:3-hydroxyacyl-CoA dehydrogenase